MQYPVASLLEDVFTLMKIFKPFSHCVSKALNLFFVFRLQAFAVQSYVTGEGPYANWIKHINDPFGYNLLTIIGNEDRVPTL